MTILIIEDNPEIRENIAELLKLANYSVLTAANGKTGVETALAHLPDLILCDIMMPELDGYGVLHILSRLPQTEGIPFIFLTAKTESVDIRKGMNLGADDYLMKPFDEIELFNAIELRLRKHKIRSKEYANTPDGLGNFLVDAGKALNMHDLYKDREVKSVKKKTDVFLSGEIPLQLFFLKSGSVKVYQSHADGKEFIISLFKAGDFFGYESLVANKPYEESAATLDDCEIVLVPKENFVILLGKNTDVATAFISLLCNRVLEKERQLVNLAYNTLRQRTAEALLKLKHLHSNEVEINTSRDDIARIVGTAAESVTRILSEFKDEHLIQITGGKISLLSREGLEKVIRWNVAR